MASSAFWLNKKVLVTGFEGFLGSHLTRELVLKGAKVIGLDKKIFRKDTLLSHQEYKKINVVKADVADFTFLKKIIKQHKIKIIFHLAAEAIVEKSYVSPLKAFKTNISGTWNVLEACRQAKVDAVIIASSDKAYGEHSKLPYKEEFALIGRHPYDVSKSCADLIASAYFKSYRLPVAVTRCGNIYGPGDFNFSRLAPDAISCLLKNKDLCIRSDGKFTRDFVYVKDIVNGYLLLAEKIKSCRLAGEAFNFSDEKPLNVLSFLNKIYSLAGKKGNFRILNRASQEIRHQFLDSAKARKTLNWKPQYTLETGLKSTIDWYKSYLNK